MVLAAVPMGARFRVKAVRPNGPVAFRMMEMGLIEGAEGRLLGRAPFGDPLQLRLGDYELSLRSNEAALVDVTTF